jgi:copper chaperone
MKNATYTITGMSCGHCLNRVNSALTKVDGIAGQQVQIGSARVDFDPEKVTEQQIAEAIANAGYHADLVKLA